MPPKRNKVTGRTSLGVSTPKTPTPAHEDSMDIDTPQADTPRAADTPSAARPNQPSAIELLTDVWTDDQTASLYKGIIRWKPSGMHKHFRMLAISEHLRNHGINPDVDTHTKIPGIWAKLRSLYNLEAIDERENYDDEDKKYKDFTPPQAEYGDMMWARRLADDPSEAASSPPQMDLDEPVKPPSLSGGNRKRKRGNTTAGDSASVAGSTTRTRGSTVEDTEEDTPLVSSPVAKSSRGTRSSKRAAAKAKAESTEPEANEDSQDDAGEEAEAEAEEEEQEHGDESEQGQDQEEQDQDQDQDQDHEQEEEEQEEEEQEESEADDATAKSTKGSSKNKGRTTRARTNTRKGRK
ncbi:putative CT20 family protein [Seiridium cardinale]